MNIRRAVAGDAAGIAELENEVFPDGWDERAVSDCICVSGAMCFVAERDGRIIAYILGRLIAPEAELYRIAVRPSEQRRGVGYRLLDYAVKTSLGLGLEQLFLEVRSENIPAISLYRSFGFKKIGVRKNYYKNPTDDAIVMLRASRADMEN